MRFPGLAAAALAALGMLATAAPGHAQQFGVAFYNDSQTRPVRIHLVNVYLGTVQPKTNWDYTVFIGNGNMYYKAQFLDAHDAVLCEWTIASEYFVSSRSCAFSSGKDGEQNSSDNWTCEAERNKASDGTCAFDLIVRDK